MRHREFMVALLNDLRALERMLAEGMFESGNRRIGAEQEMFIIDQTWAPAKGVLPILEKLNDPHFTTELGAFQLEANCDPQLLAGDGLSKMHAQLDDLVDKARKAATSLDMDVVLMGILPTLKKSHLGLDSMDLLNLAAEIARLSGIEIPERDYPSLRTMRQLEDYLATSAGH